MVWLVWRQHRGELLVVAIVLAILATALIVTGVQMANDFQQLGVASCLAQEGTPAANPNCNTILAGFDQTYGWMEIAVSWLNFIPPLLAILVGAPLVARELEQGTQRLAWTQSVTRFWWLAVKLALVLGGALLVSALLTALLTWWRGPFDQLGGRLEPYGFDFEGTAPLSYMLFALALAIAAGAIIRRSIPAMVVTLAGYLAVRLPIDNYLRSNYLPPVTVTQSPLANTNPVTRADWVLNGGWVDTHGHPISDYQAFSTCAIGPGSTKQDFFHCVVAHGWLETTVYQPASRFWLFQGIETAIFVALAAALVGLTIWWVQRRIN